MISHLLTHWHKFKIGVVLKQIRTALNNFYWLEKNDTYLFQLIPKIPWFKVFPLFSLMQEKSQVNILL